MLCGLADLGKVELVDLVVEQVVDGISECAFKSRGRRQSGSERNVSGEDSVKALYLSATLHGFPAHTEDVAGPLLLRLVLLVESELDIFIIVKRESLYFLRSVQLDLSHDSAINGSRENVTTVVVSVFTDKIDAASRSEHFAFSAEESLEFLSDSCFHFHIM